MKLCLFRFFVVFVMAAAPCPSFAFEPFQRFRRDSARKDDEKKDDKKDEKPKPLFEVETVKNLAYRTDKDADPVKHKLDLYLPKGVKNFPVLFFVHGGAWKSGNKDIYVKLGEAFAGDGIGTVIINYRLSPKVQHPAHIEDVASAYAWVCANIEKYGGRKDRIFACGHSAGGHLVALLATDEKYLKKEGRSFADIRGVIPISGVHEIAAITPLFTNVFGLDREERRDASPIAHIGKNHPPFLFLYADRDYPRLDKMAEDMNDELKKHKCETDCEKIHNRTHFSIILMPMAEADEVRTTIEEFVAKHSEWKPPPRQEAKKSEPHTKDDKK
jgi:acetyl esterase/lipase